MQTCSQKQLICTLNSHFSHFKPGFIFPVSTIHLLIWNLNINTHSTVLKCALFASTDCLFNKMWNLETPPPI